MQNQLSLDNVPLFDVPLDALIRQPVGVFLYGASGSGKSTLLRFMLESTHGKVHQIILDSEGEFHTLRTHFDYLLVGGTGADIPVRLDTAAKLAARLMEFSVSAIVDISELKVNERPQYVAAFLEQLLETPSQKWHPVIVVLDELKRFAPQSGNSASSAVVADLQARGRKRGIIPVYATQNFEGVDKEAVSEMQNRILGTIDVDVRRKRAADDFGLNAEDRALLQQMPVGQFFVRGPAFGRTPRRVQDPQTQTVKPPFGMTATPPTASEAMQSLLAHFSDVSEAKDSSPGADSVDSLHQQIADLKQRLSKPAGNSISASPTPKVVDRIVEKIVEVPVLTPEMVERATALVDSMVAHAKDAMNVAREISKRLEEYNRYASHHSQVAETPSHIDVDLVTAFVEAQKVPFPEPETERAEATTDVVAEKPVSRPVRATALASVGNIVLKPAQRKIVNTLATFAALGIKSVTRENVGAWAGMSAGGGGFAEHIRVLRDAGVVTYPTGGELGLTDAGAKLADPVNRPVTLDALHQAWLSRLPNTQQRMLKELLTMYPKGLTREELARRVEMSAGGGSFAENVRALKALGLVDYPQAGAVSATPLLFPKGLT